MAVTTFDELMSDAPLVSDDSVRFAKSLTSKNLFLSHSQHDTRHARWALGILEQAGARVYVDARDGSLSAMNVVQIADRLRSVIRECKRLVAIVTENTQTSKWVPWEMGLADAIASEDRVALFPLRQNTNASQLWARQEYFELYPRIEREYSRMSSRYTYYVHLPRSGVSISLSDWITRSRPVGR